MIQAERVRSDEQFSPVGAFSPADVRFGHNRRDGVVPQVGHGSGDLDKQSFCPGTTG